MDFTTTHTTCPYRACGCGLLLEVLDWTDPPLRCPPKQTSPTGESSVSRAGTSMNSCSIRPASRSLSSGETAPFKRYPEDTTYLLSAWTHPSTPSWGVEPAKTKPQFSECGNSSKYSLCASEILVFAYRIPSFFSSIVYRVIGCLVHLETVNLDLHRQVEVPAGLGPERLHLTGPALGLPADPHSPEIVSESRRP